MENGSKGTIAGMATSTCGTGTGCHYFTRECLKDIYRNGQRILGRVIFDAKNYIIPRYSQDSLFGPAVLYTLFGDPALRIKYPLSAIDEKERFNVGEKLDIVPNPIRSSTFITAKGKVTIYSAFGARVNELFIKGKTKWEGTDKNREKLPAGIYFIRSDGANITKKVIILK